MLITRQPGNHETPDSSQVTGDVAVTGDTHTGHGATTASITAPGSEVKTCRWFAIPATAGQIKSARLKADWSYSSAAFADGGTNQFAITYSLNGGSSWNLTPVNVTDVSGADSGSIDVELPLALDTSQVQVRDLIVASALVSGTAQITAAASNIRVEVEIFNRGLLD